MTIAITCPGFSIHGGIRVILEWANRLSKEHKVIIVTTTRNYGSPRWFNLSRKIAVYSHPNALRNADCLIITSPHAIDFTHTQFCPDNVFIFLQMIEHLFRPEDKKWEEQCRKFYTSEHPMILGSDWNYDYVLSAGRKAVTYYVENGINTNDFPITRVQKDGKTILLESPFPSNAAKDVDKLAIKVARQLKKEKYTIIGYGASRLNYDEKANDIFDEYYVSPSTELMNKLYERSTVFLKATRFDARALGPIEAFTKGCAVVRAIEKGDDDLIHGYNCEKVNYNYDELLSSVRKVLGDETYRNTLVENAYRYVEENCNCDNVMRKVTEIITDHPNKSVYLAELRKQLQ